MPNEKPVDTNIPLPQLGGLDFNNLWKQNLTNDDFVDCYKRKGIGFRVLNKESNLMFKNGYVLNNDSAQTAIKAFNINTIMKYALKNAQISGYSLIYIGYNDEGNYEDPVEGNPQIDYFYVIPRAWVEQDIYARESTDRENYHLKQSSGKILKVHKSRFIRVKNDEDEIGRFTPAYNSMQVLDHVLWSIGESMYRYGSGFPVLSVNRANDVVVGKDGTKKRRGDLYTNAMKDVSSMTYFVKDKDDDLEFQGANGKALNPAEYYDKAFQQVSVDLDVPVDILKGVAAGAVTGSETNLVEYYGDLASKQNEKISPLLKDMLDLLGIFIETEDIEYKPIWELSPEKKVTVLNDMSKALKQMELNNHLTHEQAVQFLAEQHKTTLNYEESDVRELSAAGTSQFLPEGNVTFLQPTDPIPTQTDDIKSGNKKAKDEESTLPKKTQSIEKQYARDMKKSMKKTAQGVTAILQAFNTE